MLATIKKGNKRRICDYCKLVLVMFITKIQNTGQLTINNINQYLKNIIKKEISRNMFIYKTNVISRCDSNLFHQKRYHHSDSNGNTVTIVNV